MIAQSSFEPELHSLLNKLMVEIESDRKEVEVRQKRIKKNETLLQAVRGSLSATNSTPGETGYGTKAETVRNAIQQITKSKFTHLDVEAEIKRLYPTMDVNRNRVRTTLWALANQKKELIRQTREGNNRVLPEFEKLAGATNDAPPPREQRPSNGSATLLGLVSLADIEAYVKQKNRRMNALATHFNVNESVIEQLIKDPASRVYEATRGWVKMRE